MARSRSGFAAFGAALARPLDSVAQRGATELVAAGVLLASVLWGVLPASAEATFLARTACLRSAWSRSTRPWRTTTSPRTPKSEL